MADPRIRGIVEGSTPGSPPGSPDGSLWRFVRDFALALLGGDLGSLDATRAGAASIDASGDQALISSCEVSSTSGDCS